MRSRGKTRSDKNMPMLKIEIELSMLVSPDREMIPINIPSRTNRLDVRKRMIRVVLRLAMISLLK
jgi:hypothetical protein